ncbi:ATP-dependent RNA helicase [Venturia nashicola]|uniref:ATP-dependent RNA helicase n=1 Tax=Venturia nashicola TaxID=86259 RepID=A0A4Z1P057_9PEZI|nr:ATP-dependent RNA helicase [Venturia nashicola]
METHVHRLSVTKAEDTPNPEFATTPPPRLQKKHGQRKLSTGGVYRVDTLRPFPASNDCSKEDQAPTRPEEVKREDRRTKALTAQEWATEQGFIFPRPAAAPPPIRHNINQQIRQAMMRRAQARGPKEKPLHTHYQRFDEGTFGQRVLDTSLSHPRRRSLLSAELKSEETKTANSDEPTPSQSRITTAKDTQPPSPGTELRRDSGYCDDDNKDNEDDGDVCPGADKNFQYDFGQQDILF